MSRPPAISRRGRKPKDGFLTVREQQFIKAWLCEGMPLGQAYLKIVPNASKNLAAQKGYALKEQIKKRVGYQKMMEYGGLGEELLVKKHLELLNSKRTLVATEGGKITDTLEVPDNTTQMAALKHANELAGHIVSKSEVDLAMRIGKQHWTDVLRDAESPEDESDESE